MAVHLMLAFLMITFTPTFKVVNAVDQKVNVHKELSDLLSQLDASEEHIDEVLTDESRVKQHPLLQARRERDDYVPSTTANTLETQNVTEEDINEQQNVAELLYGGDMILTSKQVIALSDLLYVSRDAIKNANLHWPGAIVPYEFSGTFSNYGRQVVANAISRYHSRTCIRFVPRTNQRDYVVFIHGAGCYSYVGRIGGMQPISLATPGCLIPGIAIHEMMHALGYYHEQSRSDRDKYITVVKNNINQKFIRNFKIEDTNLQGTPYDYGSIMHYRQDAFAKQRGLITIVVKQSGAKIGQRDGLSPIDVKSLNMLYCEGAATTTTPQPNRSTTTTISQPNQSITTTTNQPTQSTSTTTVKSFENILSMCSLLKKVGFCRFCAFKQMYCVKSCAGQPKSDRNRKCARWTAGMYCLISPYDQYMWSNCQTSCTQAHICMK